MLFQALLSNLVILTGITVAHSDPPPSPPSRSKFVARHIVGSRQDPETAQMNSSAFTSFMVQSTLKNGRNRSVKVYPSCDQQSEGLSGKDYRLDPIKGNIDGNGSLSKPFPGLEEFIKSGLRPKLEGGDRLLLLAGDHGTVTIPDLGNRDFLTIEAAGEGAPILRGLRFAGAKRVAVRGVSFESTNGKADALISINSLSSSVILEENQFRTMPSTQWDDEAWATKSASGISSRGECVSILSNDFSDLLNGAYSGGEKSILAGNKFKGIVNDNINFSVGKQWILDNVILSGRNSYANTHHPDAIQGWAGNNAITSHIVIDGNVILNYQKPYALDPQFVLPLGRKSGDTGVWMQGISLFDGHWSDIHVTGNIVSTNSILGISMLGLASSEITGNVVVGSDPNTIFSGISVVNGKDRTPTLSTIVKGNVSQILSVSTRLQPNANVIINKLVQSSLKDNQGDSIPAGPPENWGKVLHRPLLTIMREVDGPNGIYDVRMK